MRELLKGDGRVPAAPGYSAEPMRPTFSTIWRYYTSRTQGSAVSEC